MRAVDLAVFADALAGEALALAARIERGRAELRQAALERQAAAELPPQTVARLRSLGLLRDVDECALRCAVDVWSAQLEALEELQAWVEERLSVTAA